MSTTQRPQTQTPSSYRQRKWFIDFTRKTDKFQQQVQQYDQTNSPIGYTERQINDVQNVDESTRLIGMRSWAIALGPLKQAPMNVFISWMAGNTIGLFPIMFIAMLLVKPVQSIFQSSKVFEQIEGENSFLQKVTYLFGNIVLLAIALYKCHAMGLLPTYASDWLAFANPQVQMEYSAGGFSYN